jgi:hypothetical protein
VSARQGRLHRRRAPHGRRLGLHRVQKPAAPRPSRARLEA